MIMVTASILAREDSFDEVLRLSLEHVERSRGEPGCVSHDVHVDCQNRLRLFFLPPYSPDRNPDELVWKHLKADTVGRMLVTAKADFKSKVVSAMRRLQRNPAKICSFFQKPSLRYAA